MKTIEVTIVRRTSTTYEYEVGDDFDVNAPGAFAAVEDDYFNGEFGEDDILYDEVINFDVDYVAEARAFK